MASKAPMTLETGSHRSPRGFTLIEILLVLALMALAASVVLVNFVAFSERGESTNPVDVLRTAVREARFQAAADRVMTELSYDSETGQLVVNPGAQSFALNSDFTEVGRGEIRFYLIPPAEGLGALPEPNDTRLEATKVRFAPDRSSSPFVAEIDSGRGSPERIAFDPFSSIIRKTD
jgi:prepilin-type N-terminal cleavage/methylation domain-containing protein